LPAFAAQLSERAVIFIGDAKRVTEQEMLKKMAATVSGMKIKDD
jgi:hypothetical protein